MTEHPAFPSIGWRQVLQALVGIAAAVAIIAFGMPFFAHTSWSRILSHLGQVGWLAGLELFGLMAFGLWCYTFTLTGSLRGLSHSKALILNVAGSAVSNLLPGGGAVGAAASYLILRSWGFARRDISTSVIVTSVWNVLARVAMPLLGVAVVAEAGNALPKGVRTGAFVGGSTGLVVLLAFIAVLISPGATARLGRILDRSIGALLRRTRRGARVNLAELLVDQRSRISTVTAHGWLPMTFGVVAFLGIYYLLFVRCLTAVGVTLSWSDLFAAYAVGRLLSAVGVTPGGLGITEAGTLAVLVAWGAEPSSAAAGVLVFALFSHLLEVPIGALGWLAWWLSPKVEPSDP
ncbi:flippase-like domain-containing protein [Calidifontibacter sp. DB0510]|uniref:Flippase-like domain-containing protein n=1 Tax=Metallococcus carri TaxID=1656884 RepID=A0A967EB68_9MICO|nr:lysylphosphatidylglycerol synthase transmembrane domain-containing protein [Metallococcus carri]NHN56629.1 flippase-like domain-containing protein [Metallococcus carri]NOP38928.1 flippase-like domain-containing protein [Calidifontibacter sp. DB2511S]